MATLMDAKPISFAQKTPIVSFEGISLSYERGAPVLDHLDLELKAGTFHFLSGPSGAGKTSLLRLVYLSLTPDKGHLRLFGESIDARDREQKAALRRKLGIIFQDFRLLEHLNVFDNAALPLIVSGQKPVDYKNDVTELLTWVGLKDRLKAMPRELSGGEKQRLAIARAVVHRPTLILADEPTGNIDYAMGLRIMRLFVELNRLGATVLIASHDEALIRATGMPVLELNQGKVLMREPNNAGSA
jgi:cell division transport system ATP-binding protein